MGCSMPDFPVLHHLLELAHTHLHWVSDVFLPSGPLSSPSPPAFNLSQHHFLSLYILYMGIDLTKIIFSKFGSINSYINKINNKA
jgi:hypothetical protein